MEGAVETLGSDFSWTLGAVQAPSGNLRYEREKKAATAGEASSHGWARSAVRWKGIWGEMGGEVLADVPLFEFLRKTTLWREDTLWRRRSGSDSN